MGREMQIKTTMRYHVLFVRMAIFKKTRSNKYWWRWRCREKGTFVYYWWECKLVQIRKRGWSFLKQLKIELLYNAPNLFLSILSKKMKTPRNLKKYARPCSSQYLQQSRHDSNLSDIYTRWHFLIYICRLCHKYDSAIKIMKSYHLQHGWRLRTWR